VPAANKLFVMFHRIDSYRSRSVHVPFLLVSLFLLTEEHTSKWNHAKYFLGIEGAAARGRRWI